MSLDDDDDTFGVEHLPLFFPYGNTDPGQWRGYRLEQDRSFRPFWIECLDGAFVLKSKVDICVHYWADIIIPNIGRYRVVMEPSSMNTRREWLLIEAAVATLDRADASTIIAGF